MIVEVFAKGSNFKDHLENYWNVRRIERDGDCFCLIHEDGGPAMVLRTEDVELRVTY